MKGKKGTIFTCVTLIVSVFIIFIDFGSEVAQAPPTFVSGVQYDGAGGPWTLAGSPYIVTGVVTVPLGETLTIEAGVDVRFDGWQSIYVSGILYAVGTESNRINFTSNDSTPTPGDWNSIEIEIGGHLELRYSNISYGSYGIYLDESSNNNITDSNVSKNWNGIRLYRSSNNTITGNNVSNNVHYGLRLSVSPNNTVVNNHFVNDGVHIRGNDLSDFNTHTIPNTNTVNGNPLYYYKNCSGATIDGIPIGQLILANCSDVNIKNLQISYTDDAIALAHTTNTTITNNNLSRNNDGIYLALSSNVSIMNNNITYNWIGISIYRSIGNITGNNVTKNQGGISLYQSSKNNIVSNNVSSNGGHGIEISSSSNNNNIKDNNVSSNGFGIRLSAVSNNNVKDNNVSSNAWYGISLTLSSNNNITGNNVSNSLEGIRLGSSSNNRIYHNNIINNTDQAYDDLSNNLWNDTYPSGGNYWSDYSPTCTDDFGGPITPQTIPPPDGICDNQYDIDLDSMDYYPLTKSFIPPPTPPTNIMAELSGDSLENVTISWNASVDDPDPIANYAIYYSTIYDRYGLNYEFLMEIPAVGVSIYNLSIQGIGLGNPNNYFFYLQANSTNGYWNKNNTQVGKYIREFDASKHLISMPLMLKNESIENVLQTLKFNNAWYYNSTDLLDPWKSYNPSKLLNDLASVDHTMALWVDVIADSNLTIAGAVPRLTSIELRQGWNFVSYPSFIERNVSTALSGINHERIEGYVDKPPQYLRLYSDDDFMVTGYGYWIKVTADATLKLIN